MNQKITNEMLFELLREFKADVNRRFDSVDKRFEQVDMRFEQMDKRFEQIDKRFEQVDRRFEQADRRFDRSEENDRQDRSKIQEIYESRNKVVVSFTKTWAITSLFIAMIAATVSASLVNAL